MTDFFMVNEVGELIPCPREYAEYVRFKDYDEARRDEEVRLIKELSKFSHFNDGCLDEDYCKKHPKEANDEWFIVIGEQDFNKLFSKEALDEDLKHTMNRFKKGLKT